MVDIAESENVSPSVISDSLQLTNAKMIKKGRRMWGMEKGAREG